VIIELLVCESPHFSNTFSVSRNSMKTLPIFILLLIFSISCQKTETKNNVDLKNEIKKNKVKTSPKTDTLNTINFKDFSLEFEIAELEKDEYYKDKPKTDSIYLILTDLAETIEGKTIKIDLKNKEISDMKIEQCYETSITISNEGPHCDLIEWKHYISEWKTLQTKSKNIYVCETYSEEESQKFPQVNIDDLKKYVKDNCGDEYFEITKNINNPNELPSSIGISRYIFKISWKTNKSSNNKKYIVISNLMGC